MSTTDILLLGLVLGVLVYVLDQRFGRGQSRHDNSTKKSDS